MFEYDWLAAIKYKFIWTAVFEQILASNVHATLWYKTLGTSCIIGITEIELNMRRPLKVDWHALLSKTFQQ